MTGEYNITMNYSTYAEGVRDISQAFPTLPNLLLLFTFLIIGLSGAVGSRKFTGISNIWQWFTISGLVTSTIAFILFAVEGIVTIETVGIALAVTIGCALFYFLADRDDY